MRPWELTTAGQVTKPTDHKNRIERKKRRTRFSRFRRSGPGTKIISNNGVLSLTNQTWIGRIHNYRNPSAVICPNNSHHRPHINLNKLVVVRFVIACDVRPNLSLPTAIARCQCAWPPKESLSRVKGIDQFLGKFSVTVFAIFIARVNKKKKNGKKGSCYRVWNRMVPQTNNNNYYEWCPVEWHAPTNISFIVYMAVTTHFSDSQAPFFQLSFQPFIISIIVFGLV